MGPTAPPRAGGRCGSCGSPLPQRRLPARRRRQALNVLRAQPAGPVPQGSSPPAAPGPLRFVPRSPTLPCRRPPAPGSRATTRSPSPASSPTDTSPSPLQRRRGRLCPPGGSPPAARTRRRPPLARLPRPGSARGFASHRHFPASPSSWEVSDLLSAQKEEELLGGAFHFSLLPFYWLLDDFYSLSLIQEETAESLGELHY